MPVVGSKILVERTGPGRASPGITLANKIKEGLAEAGKEGKMHGILIDDEVIRIDRALDLEKDLPHLFHMVLGDLMELAQVWTETA